MMMNQFIDREREMEFLNEFHARKGAQMVILYGRRRTGKTRLLQEFLRDKDGFYFMAVETSLQANLKKLQEKMGLYLKDQSFNKLNIGGFEELFEEFFKWNEKKRILIVLDEFPNLFHNHPSVLSEFQRAWDSVLAGKDLHMVLCGSSIGMMENKDLVNGN
jgi:AAA+ ATPase superfamily predicted ATPase